MAQLKITPFCDNCRFLSSTNPFDSRIKGPSICIVNDKLIPSKYCSCEDWKQK